MQPREHVAVDWQGLRIALSSMDRHLWQNLDGARDPIRLGPFALHEHGYGDSVAVVRHDSANVPPGVTVRERRDVVIAGPTDYWAGGERLGCVLLQTFDAELLRRGRAVLHGAAIELDGEVVVLTGPSDSGKTSLAFELCRAGGRLVANDHVMIDLTGARPHVLSSQDHVIAFRSHALWLNDRELYERLLGRADEPLPYARLRVPPAQLGIGVASGAFPLRMICFVALGTTALGTRYPTPAARALVKLHADITSRVHASNLVLLQDNGEFGPALPDLVDRDVDRAASDAVARLVELGLVHDLRGDVRWCVEELADNARIETIA